jgi:hypothetical protein
MIHGWYDFFISLIILLIFAILIFGVPAILLYKYLAGRVNDKSKINPLTLGEINRRADE